MKFKVGLYYEESGYCTVEAESKEEAERKVYKMLENEGASGIEKEWGLDVVHREYDTTSSEESKE